MIKRIESEYSESNLKSPINGYSHNTDNSTDPTMTKDCQIEPCAAKLPSSKAGSLADIKQTLKIHMPELAKHYKIKSLGIFGSYIRGEAEGTSDVDLLVEFL
jgi:hypothetical protein